MKAAALALASSLLPGTGDADLLFVGDASTGSGGSVGDPSGGGTNAVLNILGEATASWKLSSLGASLNLLSRSRASALLGRLVDTVLSDSGSLPASEMASES